MRKIILASLLCALALSTVSPAMAARSQKAIDDGARPALNTALQSDPEGTISFTHVSARMRENNLTLLQCQETLDSLYSVDREKVYKKLVDSINAMTDASWMLNQMSAINPLAAIQANNLNSTADSLRDQLENYKEDNYNKNLFETTWQMQSSMNQIVAAGESLYVSILSTQVQKDELNQTLDATGRTLSEMRTRYQLGQISAMQLNQVESGYNTLKGNIDSLNIGIETMKASLEYMLGLDMEGEITLSQTPSVSAKQLSSISYEDDLKAAKSKSFSLYQADKTLDDAKEDWDDAQKDYSTSSYLYKVAQHTYQAAVYQHDSAIKNFDLSFRNLYTNITSAQKALKTNEDTLAYKLQELSITQVKYRQGSITYNALLAAQEAADTAQRNVESAKLDLFSAYHTYRTAVELGILNNSN